MSFRTDFSNNSPLVVANHATNVNPVLAKKFFESKKLNGLGINMAYERPFIDGPLLGEIR